MNNNLTPASFEDMREELTVALSSAIFTQLVRMGDSAKNISWFSSSSTERAMMKSAA